MGSIGHKPRVAGLVPTYNAVNALDAFGFTGVDDATIMEGLQETSIVDDSAYPINAEAKDMCQGC